MVLPVLSDLRTQVPCTVGQDPPHVCRKSGRDLDLQRRVKGAVERLTGMHNSEDFPPPFAPRARRRPATRAYVTVPEARKTRHCSHYIQIGTRIRATHQSLKSLAPPHVASA